MADAGKLSLGIVWDGAAVQTVEIRSTRPMAATLLKGKTPVQAMQLVPLLFSVCGRAQGAATTAALQAAQGMATNDLEMTERMVGCEVLQEHLWRMLLDWSKALGLPQQEKMFVKWHAMLRGIAAGKSDMAGLRREFEHDWLGMKLSDWRVLGDAQIWWTKNESPAAQLLAKLDAKVNGGSSMHRIALLPAWTAAQAQLACAGRWSTEFSAAPDSQGRVAETGAWSYYAGYAMLSDDTQSTVLRRVLARLIDVVELLGEAGVPRVDAFSPAEGEGLAVVRTARGLLMHHVVFEAERVRDYVIVAPTEWNFHVGGAFAQNLLGMEETDEERLQHRAQLAALSLDPCVPFQIEIRKH